MKIVLQVMKDEDRNAYIRLEDQVIPEVTGWYKAITTDCEDLRKGEMVSSSEGYILEKKFQNEIKSKLSYI